MFLVKHLVLIPALLFSAASQVRKLEPEFAVVSVKRCDGRPGPTKIDETDHTVRYQRISLLTLVVRAHETTVPQLANREKLGGPQDAYDITANLPEGTPKQQIPAMMRRLLAGRFHLVTHHETRERPAYVLAVDKGGLKLKPASSSPPRQNQPGAFSMRNHPFLSSATGRLHFEGAMTIEQFAKALSITIWEHMGAPLLDMTGIAGEFEIVFDTRLPRTNASADPPVEGDITLPDGRRVSADAPSLATAFHQLGLKLESRKIPADCLVIDQVSKYPTEN